MRTYIEGYYSRDELHLQVLNKESNRKILEALRNAYPLGMDALELAKQTGLPLKTIYAQRAELYREYYITEQGNVITTVRGRPSLNENLPERSRKKLVVEETNGIHDAYEGKKPIPLPPGNVVYSDDFINSLHPIVADDEEELCTALLHFLEKAFTRMSNHPTDKIRRRWAPERDLQFCCSQCGLNHEARDFMRAVLLHLIDELERHSKFIDFMKDNHLITQEAYDLAKTNIQTKKN